MSKIEWTDKTWNPIIGCSHVSPACDHCYAERMAFRLSHNPKAPIEYRNVVTDFGAWTGQTALVESVIEKPLHWSKPCRVFVGSMTDLFHEDTPFEWIDRVFAVMALSPRITFQVLTKRPGRMQEYLYRRNGTAVKVRCKAEIIGRNLPDNHPGLSVTNWRRNGMNQVHAIWPLPNVWLGVTVENQEQADKRVPILRDTPTAVRFVSVEPMLGPVNLAPYFWDDHVYTGDDVSGFIDYKEGLDWVICGGETGNKARPMHPDWPVSIQRQCAETRTPFFFKQWGEFQPLKKANPAEDTCQFQAGAVHAVKHDGRHLHEVWVYDPEVFPWPEDMWWMDRVGKKAAGRELDGKLWNEFPDTEGK